MNKQISNSIKTYRPNGISILRVIAVLLVLIVHFGQSLPLPSSIHRIIGWSQYGVQLFFLISGYLVWKSLTKDSSIKRFYFKRLLRILPAYWAIVLLSFIIYGPLLHIAPSDTMHISWIRYVLFLQTLIPANNLIWNNLSGLWTMTAFFVFYLIAPFIFRLLNSTRKLCISVVVFYLASIASPEIYGQLNLGHAFANSIDFLSIHNPFVDLWVFLAGALIFTLEKSESKSSYWVLFTIGIYSLIFEQYVAVLVIFMCWALARMNLNQYDLGTPLNAAVRVFDKYSYSIYLGHTFVLALVSKVGSANGTPRSIQAVLAVGLTLAVVWSLHNFVERPFEKMKNRLI